MTIEQHIENLKKLKSFHNGSYGATIDTAIKALEQEPCEDAITKQAVLDAMSDTWKHICSVARRRKPTKGEEAVYSDMVDTVKSMSPVNPQPKTGHWIKSNVPNEEYVCSECGGGCWYYDYQADVAKSMYCPNCGAKMEVSDGTEI